MDRTAVFVDAGYLFASGSRLLAGKKLLRSELHLDHAVVLELLTHLAREVTGLRMLRIYWYDGASGQPSPQQLELAYRPNVKLRLGLVNEQGQQEGVDGLLVSDLTTLARNRAIAEALLVTGDDDLRAGVQQAQELGVRVHLLGVPPARENQAGSLVQEVDTVSELTEAEVRSFLRVAPSFVPAAAETRPTPTRPALDLNAVAARIVAELTEEELEALRTDSAGGLLPAPLDRRLLVAGSTALDGAPLSADQKRQLRTAFTAALGLR